MKRIFNFLSIVALLFAVSHSAASMQSREVLSDKNRSRSRDAATGDRGADRVAANDDSASLTSDQRRLREIGTLEQQCLDEVNRLRRMHGLSRLMFDDSLLEVARGYSRRMSDEHFFSHVDPDGLSVRERIERANIKWKALGENLAYANGYVNPVAASLHGWMESPGHRSNILDPDFQVSAVGVWIGTNGTVYFTEIFLKP